MQIKTITFILFLILGMSAFASTNIPSNDPNIQYIGRFDKTNPLSPTMSWTGSQIIAKFQGTSIGMIMNTPLYTCYLNVVIDGKITVVQTIYGNNTYSLGTGLTDTIHTVTIFKRDSPWSYESFNGFILDNGKALVSPPDRKIRRIEFYGDSQTQGAKVEVTGLGADATTSGPFDNNYNSYASITARALHAECICIAQNGASLTPINGKTNIPYVFDRNGSKTTDTLWDFNSWLPEVVCVNLGVNDNPLPTDFTIRYVTFVQQIRVKYPNAFIFLLTGMMGTGSTLQNAIKATVTTLNGLGDAKVYDYAFTYTYNHAGHPRIADNVVFAKELVAKIKTVIWGVAEANLPVEDVYISPVPFSLGVNSKQQLSATVSPFDAVDQQVSWSSFDPSILGVDQTGLITSVSAGTATITATSHDGNKTAICTIVVPAPVLGNMLLNSGFESALTTGWTSSYSWGGQKLNTTSPRTGLSCLEIGPSAPVLAAQLVTGGFVTGGTYNLSAWSKLIVGNGRIYIGATATDINGKSTSFISSNVTDIASYEKKNVAITLPDNTVSLKCYVYLNTSVSTTVALIDDFEIKYVATLPNAFNAIQASNISIKLFPNPVCGKNLNVSTQGLRGEKIFSLVDLTGKLLFTQKLVDAENQTIQLKDLIHKGTYIARIKNESYNYSQKLVLQ